VWVFLMSEVPLYTGISWITRKWIFHRPYVREYLREIRGFLLKRLRKGGQNPKKMVAARYAVRFDARGSGGAGSLGFVNLGKLKSCTLQ